MMLPPMEKIRQFLEWYPDAAEVKSILWMLVEAAMASPIADTWTADERSNMLFFFSRMSEFTEGIYAIAPPLLQITHCSDANE